ncbi:MAG: ABC transporter permease [Candidatus Bathyarchaeota archaeon]|nr:ABC transporter permease [Candidatus Bathyarchaeota archaeon]
MSIRANFSLNDLFRRRLQTSLTLVTLTLSVASTLFLLLFGSRLGLGISSATGTLTWGLAAIFQQFLLFIGVLIFAVGAVLSSFIVFLMMAQRIRDFGLIKAAGCPNSLVGGYFMTELLTITVLGCVLGIAFGFLADFAMANLVFSGYSLPNFWFAPVVFAAFFALALIFGLNPILKASRMSAISALSPVNYYGITTATKHKPLSRRGITWRIALRSLFRRQSASIRIVVLLSIVFILLTVSICGGIVANDTTTSWVQKTVDKNTIAIAHSSMATQYKLLLTKFSGAHETGAFNYADPNLGISNSLIETLNALPTVNFVDSRLILFEYVQEVGNFTIDPETKNTLPVGDSRKGESIVIGVDPEELASDWSVKGRFLCDSGDLEAVIGDSISQKLYSPHPSKYVVLADPLLESIKLQNTTFRIVGVCIDPINNGFVTYVPIQKLMNVTQISSPNLLIVKIADSADLETALTQIRNTIQATDSNLEAFDLNDLVAQNTAFLSSSWQTILLLPLFTLASAAFCLVGYMMLSVDEQHQEFAILRAVGAKPRIIINVSAIQSGIVLLSSFGVGISFGIIITLLILMTNPLVTTTTVLVIAVWLASALISMFLFSLIPAFRLSKTSILKIMT